MSAASRYPVPIPRANAHAADPFFAADPTYHNPPRALYVPQVGYFVWYVLQEIVQNGPYGPLPPPPPSSYRPSARGRPPGGRTILLSQYVLDPGYPLLCEVPFTPDPDAMVPIFDPRTHQPNQSGLVRATTPYARWVTQYLPVPVADLDIPDYFFNPDGTTNRDAPGFNALARTDFPVYAAVWYKDNVWDPADRLIRRRESARESEKRRHEPRP